MRKYLLQVVSNRNEAIDILKRFAPFMPHFKAFAKYAWLEICVEHGGTNWILYLVRKPSSYAFEGDFNKSLMLADALDEATKISK